MRDFDEKNEENPQLQLGLCDKDWVLKFRQYTESKDFKKSKVLKIMVIWWLSLDEQVQKDLFFLTDEQLASAFEGEKQKQIQPQILALLKKLQKLASDDCSPNSIAGEIEMIKDFVKYKIPSEDEARQLEALRQVLSDDIAARADADKQRHNNHRHELPGAG